MLKNTIKIVLLALTVAGLASSCKKKDEASDFIPTPKEDTIAVVPVRKPMSYDLAKDTTAYARLFVDSLGKSTVDIAEGNTLLSIFQDSISGYARKATTIVISADELKNKYRNYKNAAGNSVHSLTASSRANSAESDKIRTTIEGYFTSIATASQSNGVTASRGQAGKLGTYLVDAKGLEPSQLIAKGLIGNFQIDYIGNVLLGAGLDADNKQVVAGKTYTALEHNWDLAFSTLTKKSYYGKDAKLTPGITGATSGESQLGSYVWEYNQDAFKQLNKAFVKGRIAIVNNDKAELKTQAEFIRRAFEKAVAQAALGYLKKWKDGADDAVRAHAIGEGYGFIYSLRSATLNGGNDQYSDDILNALISSDGGFWDLTNDKINVAGTAISTKFGVDRPW